MHSRTRSNAAQVVTSGERRQIMDYGPGCSKFECSYGNHNVRARNNEPCLQCRELDWRDCSSKPGPREEIDAQNARHDRIENQKACKAQNKKMTQKANKAGELEKHNAGSASNTSTASHPHVVEKPSRAELEGSPVSGETARGASCEQTRLSCDQPPSSVPSIKELPALPIDQHITKPKPVYSPYRIGDSSRLPAIIEDPASNVPRHRLSTETHRAIKELCPPELSTSFDVSYPDMPQIPPPTYATTNDRSRLPGYQPRPQQQKRSPSKRAPSHAQSKPLPKPPITEAESDQARRKSNRNSSILPDAQGRTCISRGSGEFEPLVLPQEGQDDDDDDDFKVDTLNRSAHGAQVRICRD